MSLHSSLRIDSAGSQQRTVLTRIERIKDLMKRGLWVDGRSVTALPKTKIVRVKASKKAKKEEGEGAEAAAQPEGAAAAAPAAPAVKAAAKPAK